MTLPQRLPPTALHRLGEVRAPCFVITGSRDLPDFLSIRKALESGLPDVQQETMEGVGHMVNLEAPEQFNEILVKFWPDQCFNT